MGFDRRNEGIGKVPFACGSDVTVHLDLAAFERAQRSEEKDGVVACPVRKCIAQSYGLSQRHAREQRFFGQSYSIERVQQQTVVTDFRGGELVKFDAERRAEGKGRGGGIKITFAVK